MSRPSSFKIFTSSLQYHTTMQNRATLSGALLSQISKCCELRVFCVMIWPPKLQSCNFLNIFHVWISPVDKPRVVLFLVANIACKPLIHLAEKPMKKTKMTNQHQMEIGINPSSELKWLLYQWVRHKADIGQVGWEPLLAFLLNSFCN